MKAHHKSSPEGGFEGISEKIRERYHGRYAKLGRDVKSLGWGTSEQQNYRFSQILHCGADFSGKNILDIGCGFGDLFAFLKNQSISLASYEGWDLNSDFVKEASSRFFDDGSVCFREKNILTENTDENPIVKKWNIGVMLGLINFNWGKEYDSTLFAQTLIERAFSLVDTALIFDFLSTHRTPNYPKEDFVVYFSPDDMMDFCLKLTNNVVLLHNYNPIPQKEGMVCLFKNVLE